MSASPAPADACPSCGGDLPLNARFCPACGITLAGPGPVHVQRAEPRWFGVTPPHLLLGVAVGLCVFALALFATGRWPYGLVLLGVGALLLAAFLDAARGRPGSVPTRASDARERAHSVLEAYRARSMAATEARRIQSRLLLLESERRAALLELGSAAHARDSTAEAGVRARLDELDARDAELRAHLDSSLKEAEERIHKARLPVEETVMVLPTEPSPPPERDD
jgi:hypothetical protein